MAAGDDRAAGASARRFLDSDPSRSASTRVTYGYVLVPFLRWRGRPGIDRASYTRYLSKLQQERRRPNTVAMTASVLREYAMWRGVPVNRAWPRPRNRRVLVQGLSPAEEARLRGATKNDRERFAVEFLLRTGLRVSEFVALGWRDAALDPIPSMPYGALYVRHAKGERPRVIPLSRPAERALRAWAGACRVDPDAPDRSGPVSPYRSRFGVNEMLVRLARRAGLPSKRIFPHLLRHTMAYRFRALDQGRPEALQKILGHASLNTTSRYGDIRVEEGLSARYFRPRKTSK